MTQASHVSFTSDSVPSPAKAAPERALYLGAYFLAYFQNLFNPGIYWDDWVIYRVSAFDRLQLQAESSRPLYGHLSNVFMTLGGGGTLFAHALIFVHYLLAMLIVDALLKRIPAVTAFARISITLLFGIVPLNYARACASVTAYSFSYALFFVGWWLFLRHAETRKLGFRIGALISLYFAFAMESVIPLLALMLPYLLYVRGTPFRSFREVGRGVAAHLDLILLPALFFFVKAKFYPSYGPHAVYNVIAWEGIRDAPARIIDSFRLAFESPFRQMYHAMPWALPGTALIGYLAYRAYTRWVPASRTPAKIAAGGVAVGLIAFSLGAFPYAVVNKPLRLDDWDSRNQILVPLGIALTVFFLIELVTRSFRARRTVMSLLIGAFVTLNIHAYFGYLKDWTKQLAIMEAFRESEIIREHTSFHFVDRASELNAFGRGYRFYEFNGMFRRVFGDARRYGSLAGTLPKPEDLQIWKSYPRYGMTDFQVRPYEYTVTIEHGPNPLTTLKVIEIGAQWCFSREKYRESLHEAISLRYEPVH